MTDDHDFARELRDKLKEKLPSQQKIDEFVSEVLRAINARSTPLAGGTDPVGHAEALGGIPFPKIPNPLEDLSKKAKCATCVAGWATAAAAIALYAAGTGGIGIVTLQGWIVAEFGVSSAVALKAASAAVAGASAGGIAYAMCPDCA
jgi:hypothetical protein